MKKRYKWNYKTFIKNISKMLLCISFISLLIFTIVYIGLYMPIVNW